MFGSSLGYGGSGSECGSGRLGRTRSASCLSEESFGLDRVSGIGIIFGIFFLEKSISSDGSINFKSVCKDLVQWMRSTRDSIYGKERETGEDLGSNRVVTSLASSIQHPDLAASPAQPRLSRTFRHNDIRPTGFTRGEIYASRIMYAYKTEPSLNGSLNTPARR